MSLSYSSALAYLNHFTDHSKTHAANLAPENFNLARVRALMTALGDPHLSYPVIHIAGTKGKGSTAAFCAGALQAAGYKTGLYTSPHLVDYTERFQINRTPILPNAFAALVEDIQPHVAQIPATTSFEIEAALAFWYFARQDVQAAVIEVGMGGRLDATNVVHPVVSVITTISLDHVPILGHTVAEIAGEKAGIIKEGRPVVSGPQTSPARAVIHAIAREQHAPLVQVGEQVTFTAGASYPDKQRFHLQYREEAPVELEISLLGPHQIENATTAYAALRVAHEQGLSLPADAIRTGFATTAWPGRFEILTRDPVPLILDGAHNQDSARRLRETLHLLFPDRPVVWVFGVSGDKNVREMLAELRSAGPPEMLIATQSAHARAMPAAQLAALAQAVGFDARAHPHLAEAVALARATVPAHGLILITGSLFVVGEARPLLKLG
ncbi:MAG: bifunctional folylpolyglutamate synthase/dihydrofolate synthase [Anaerolineales bacterium]|nr:bifunctional folylpolyglutamate synthase/dihydrofolate synthase [Anaerolineales bacterium]